MYIFAAALLALPVSLASAQSEVGTQSFGGQFTIHYNEDDTRNFYAVDLSQFADESSKKSFIKKVYYDSQLVATNSPDASGVWCLTAHKVFTKDQILQKLNNYKNELTTGETTQVSLNNN